MLGWVSHITEACAYRNVSLSAHLVHERDLLSKRLPACPHAPHDKAGEFRAHLDSLIPRFARPSRTVGYTFAILIRIKLCTTVAYTLKFKTSLPFDEMMRSHRQPEERMSCTLSMHPGVLSACLGSYLHRILMVLTSCVIEFDDG